MFFSYFSGSEPLWPLCKGSDYCMGLSMEGGTSPVIFSSCRNYFACMDRLPQSWRVGWTVVSMQTQEKSSISCG